MDAPRYIQTYYQTREALVETIRQGVYEQQPEQLWPLIWQALSDCVTPGLLTVLAQTLKHHGYPELADTVTDYQTLLFSSEPLSSFSQVSDQGSEIPVPYAPLQFFSAPPKVRVSICMIVKNERDILPRALDSVNTLADEIIVVDTGSTDGTQAMLEQRYPQVRRFDFPWCDDFSAARNHSLAQAQGDWIFVLDADEALTSESQRYLRQFFRYPPLGWHVFSVSQGHYLDNGETWMVEISRLFRNHSSVRYFGLIHEQVCRFEAPYYLHGMVLTQRVFLQHWGMQTETVTRQQKDKRVSMLQRSLEDPRYNTPYARYQYAEYLAAQSPSDDIQVEILLQSALKETLERWQLPPSEPTWCQAPLSLTTLALYRIWWKQRAYSKILNAFEQYRPYCQYAEFYWIAASSLLKQGQRRLARYWFHFCFKPELRASMLSSPFKKQQALRGLLGLSLDAQQPWETLSLVYQLQHDLPDDPYLKNLQHQLHQAMQLNEPRYFSQQETQMIQALQARQFKRVVQVGYQILTHHTQAVVLYDVILALGFLGYHDLAQGLLHYAMQLFSQQSHWGELKRRLELLGQTVPRQTDEALLPGGYHWRQLFFPVDQRPQVSLVMIVKNEAAQIVACLDAVAEVVDEIILVDTGSQDQTQAVAMASRHAEKLRCFNYPWQGDFAAARNFAAAQASGDWLFSLDADERLSPDSLSWLRWFFSFRPMGCQAFALTREDMYENPLENSQSLIPRIYPKDRRIGFSGPVHNVLARQDQPVLLHICPLPPAVKLLHKGYHPELIKAQGKAKRYHQLQNHLRIQGYLNPYYAFHYGWYLMYQQAEPDLNQALHYFEQSLIETQRYGDEPPVLHWLPGPVFTLMICIMRVLSQQAACEAVLSRYPRYQEAWHYDEMHYWAAWAALELNDTTQFKKACMRALTASHTLLPQAGFGSWRVQYLQILWALKQGNTAAAIEEIETLLGGYASGELPDGTQLQALLSRVVASARQSG